MQTRLLILLAIMVVVVGAYFALSGQSTEEAYFDPDDTRENLLSNLENEGYYELASSDAQTGKQTLLDSGDPAYAAVGRVVQFKLEALQSAKPKAFLNSLKRFFRTQDVPFPTLKETKKGDSFIIYVDSRPCLISDPSDAQTRDPAQMRVDRCMALANTLLREEVAPERLYLLGDPPALIRLTPKMFNLIQSTTTVGDEFKPRYID
jgi:hypothetical protein